MSGGLYVVLLRLPRQLEARVGNRGPRRLPPGWYMYTGSARRGLDARVARHLRHEKRVRWHIDHLTTQPTATVLGALVLRGSGAGGPDTVTECTLNQTVGRLVGGDCPIRGFGAGDCRSGCPAHLWRSSRRLTLKALAADLAAAGMGTPEVVRRPRANATDTRSAVSERLGPRSSARR